MNSSFYSSWSTRDTEILLKYVAVYFEGEFKFRRNVIAAKLRVRYIFGFTKASEKNDIFVKIWIINSQEQNIGKTYVRERPIDWT